MPSTTGTTIPGPDVAIFFCCILVGVGGLFTNGTLAVLIILSKELRRKDYIWFILNRTVMDLLSSLLLVALQPVAILMTDPHSDTCAAAGFLALSLAAVSLYSEPLLACNRYVSMMWSNQYDCIYTKRNIWLMCACSWTLGILTGLPHIVLKSLGRIPGALCSLTFTLDTTVIVVSSIFILVGLGSTTYFNFKMFFFLNKYQQQPMNNNQRTDLQNDREILRFLFVATFLPVTLQCPSALIVILRAVITFSDWIVFIAVATYISSFLTQPVVTLLMVRHLRHELVKLFRMFSGSNAVGAM